MALYRYLTTMYHLLIALALTFFPGALADSAPGFPIQVSAHLTTYFDYSQNYADVSSDRDLTTNDTLYAPEVYKPSNETGDETYLLLMIDPDVQYKGQTVQVLQWLQPNLRGTPRLLRPDAIAQNATNNPGAFYYPATPEDGTERHYYTFVLYHQSVNWTVPEKYANFSPPANVVARGGFNVTDFVASSGLGEAIASNYFWVDVKNKTVS